jgi:hypothetical protein
MKLTEIEKRRAIRLLELLSMGEQDDEAQSEFDWLVTTELQLLFAKAILAIANKQNE